MRALTFCVSLCVGVVLAGQAAAEEPYQVAWVRQLGTSASDSSLGVAGDGLGNVYISGNTYGSLGGPNAGGSDAFVARYDTAGNLVWTRQLGTSSAEFSLGVSADGLKGVYISGYTYGALGAQNAGSSDAFVAKYDVAGALVWTRQLGTGRVDYGLGLSADGLGNVYISGSTQGSLGGPNAGGADAFVAKYDDAGNLLWTRQLGTSGWDYSEDVSADGLGNVYISGGTDGSLGGPNAGDDDAFLAKYDSAGNLLWTRQVGGRNSEQSWGASANELGNIYISGATWSSLGGPKVGGMDAFVSKYGAAGNLLWTQQLGTTGDEYSLGVCADGENGVYISGYTLGALGGPNAGEMDAWVARLIVPEPATWLLLTTGGLSVASFGWRRHRHR